MKSTDKTYVALLPDGSYRAVSRESMPPRYIVTEPETGTDE